MHARPSADGIELTLPLEFDTRRPQRQVLQLVGILLFGVLLPSASWVLVVRHEVMSALGLVGFMAFFSVFGVQVVRHMAGAEGRITRDAVEARPGRLWGLALPGPVGTFAVRDFRGVRIERALGSAMTSAPTTGQERVTLVGRQGTPDILVMREPLRLRHSPGAALAAALDLPVLDGSAAD